MSLTAAADFPKIKSAISYPMTALPMVHISFFEKESFTETLFNLIPVNRDGDMDLYESSRPVFSAKRAQ